MPKIHFTWPQIRSVHQASNFSIPPLPPILASLIVGRCPHTDDDTLRASLKYPIELHLVCDPRAENLSAVCDVINTQPTLIVTDYYETVPHEESHSQLVQQEFTATVEHGIN